MQSRSNPQGRRVTETILVRMGRGKMVHAKHPQEPGTLCAPRDGIRKAWTAKLRVVAGQTLNCYRCIKVMAINEELRGDALLPAGRSRVESLLRQKR